MALDDTTDPLISVVGSLVTAHVNGELAAIVGGNAIVATYHHPTPLRILSAIAMPSLSVARGESRSLRRGAQRVEELVPITFTYVTPPVALERLGLRWPLLENVWKRLRAAVFAGRSPHYASGVDVFTPASVEEVVEASASKREHYVDEGQGVAYPAFEATISLWVSEPSDVEYDDLLSILATYNLVGTVGTDVPGLVTDLVTFSAPVFDSDEEVDDGDDDVFDG